MKGRYLAYVVAAVVAATAVWWIRHSHRALVPVQRAFAPTGESPPVVPLHPSRVAALVAEIAPDSISPIAADLNSPSGSPRRDLEILNEVFGAWQTNFPHKGNPVGENDEITAALAGGNPLHFAFISPRHPAINALGELCDRWGTPFRFHALSGTQMEIRSAGPDRKFGTNDDVGFAPWPKTF
jgi:hypothetical protein